jgi:hypothetical protein
VTISNARGRRLAMVVFVDSTECYWLQSLKRGFRHCFVALEHGPAWLVCDSLKSHIELTVLDLPPSFDLGRCYADQGHHVLVGQIGQHVPRATVALTPLTCVSVAKRLLAIRAAWVWTPWQLFSHLLHAQPHIWRLVHVSEAPRASLTRGTIDA